MPKEVLDIMREVAKYQYKRLKEAGWCVNCYRKKNNGTVRCDECAEIHARHQESINRKAGNKPWRAGEKGRPPKLRLKEVT